MGKKMTDIMRTAQLLTNLKIDYDIESEDGEKQVIVIKADGGGKQDGYNEFLVRWVFTKDGEHITFGIWE
jgi:hypothetical protein